MTVIDSSIQNSTRNWLLGFGAIVVAATALTLALTGSSTDTHYKQPKVNLANDKIPDERQEEDPEIWSVIELREWLAKVCLLLYRSLSSGLCEIAPPTCSVTFASYVPVDVQNVVQIYCFLVLLTYVECHIWYSPQRLC
jgi:hypothetical protein